jgi:DNA-binding XRE family transcriptional regulator
MAAMEHEQEQDFLDEMIAEFTASDPNFPQLLAEEVQRRELIHDLAALRAEHGLSQRAVAQCMDTSPSAVARLEAGASDVKLSTLQRYAAALGKKIEWRVVDA